MRYNQSEKMQIIRLVEESPLSIKQTLLELNINRSTFYIWCMSSKGFGQVGHKNRRWFQVPNTFFQSIKQPLMNNYTSCVEAWFFS